MSTDHNFWSLKNSNGSKTSSLIHSSTPTNPADKAAKSSLLTPGKTNKIYEIITQQEISNQSMRYGVYINNCEIFDKRHPAQVQYKAFHVTKMPDLPVGLPLAKPPHLCVHNHPILPIFSQPTTEESLSTKIEDSSSEPEIELACSRKRLVDGENDGKIKEKPSKCTRLNNTKASISSKKLSKEERLFLDAAIALSASKDLIQTKDNTTKCTKEKHQPSGRAMPPPPSTFHSLKK